VAPDLTLDIPSTKIQNFSEGYRSGRPGPQRMEKPSSGIRKTSAMENATPLSRGP
jgi:hypothetical protein